MKQRDYLIQKRTPPGNRSGGRRCAKCAKEETLYYHNGKSMCQQCIVDFAEATLEIYKDKAHASGRAEDPWTVVVGDTPSYRTAPPTLKESREGYTVTAMDMDFLFTQVKEMKNALDRLARQLTGINLSHGDLAKEVHENTQVLKDLIEELSE